ncbi:MAG: hypothetical protein QGH20_08735 [Candidatus Latescibacteria bacterium]|nr:hypothetical protein [Candidatus Latescibacterota bacterium]
MDRSTQRSWALLTGSTFSHKAGLLAAACLGLLALGCSPRYQLLEGTGYQNPPPERIRIAISPFVGVGSRPVVADALGEFLTGLFVDGLSDTVAIAAVRRFDALGGVSRTTSRERVSNILRVVPWGVIDSVLVANGEQLSGRPTTRHLELLARTNATDLLMVGEYEKRSVSRQTLADDPTAPPQPFELMGVARVVIVDLSSGKVLGRYTLTARSGGGETEVAVWRLEIEKTLSQILWRTGI